MDNTLRRQGTLPPPLSGSPATLAVSAAEIAADAAVIGLLLPVHPEAPESVQQHARRGVADSYNRRTSAVTGDLPGAIPLCQRVFLLDADQIVEFLERHQSFLFAYRRAVSSQFTVHPLDRSSCSK